MSWLEDRQKRCATANRPMQGFTLVELLVALAIFAFMYAMFSGFFTQFLQGREQVKQRSGEIEQLQKALAYMTLDMEQLVARPVRDEYGDLQPALKNTEAGGIEFTRAGWANPFDFYPRSQLQRVLYQLHDNKLYRRYWDAPDRNVATEFHDNVLLDGVKSMKIRFLEQQDNGQYLWQEYWPTLDNQSITPLYQPLPVSVEIILELEAGYEFKRYFRLVANPWSLVG